MIFNCSWTYGGYEGIIINHKNDHFPGDRIQLIGRYRPMRNSKVVVLDFNPGKALLLRGRPARFVTRDRPAAKFLGSATGSVCAVRERAIAKLLRGAGDSMAAFVAFRGSCPTAKFLGSDA